MNEETLRRLIGAVKSGRLSRRGFVTRMAAVGLTAPMATQLLAIAGAAPARCAVAAGLSPDAARRRRAAEDPLLAGARRC